MIVVLATGATREETEQVVQRLAARGYRASVSEGVEKTVVGAIGIADDAEKQLLSQQLRALSFVERVVPILKPYKLASRESQPEPTTFTVGGVRVGRPAFCVIAGPCSVESEKQIVSSAQAVKAAGAHMLRGGAFKPRTSPYDFQGLGDQGLEFLAAAREVTGLPVVTEVLDPRQLERVVAVADVLQIGARNMQNFGLLKAVGECRTPVLLKRGMSATVDEWIKAAEYILAGGNHHVMLCERGIRTYETATRNTLDLNAVPVAKGLTHLPVFVDPSHGAGRADIVAPLSLAAAAAGADGLIIEVHPNPADAMSDAQQQLAPEAFSQLMQALAPVVAAVHRELDA